LRELILLGRADIAAIAARYPKIGRLSLATCIS
jgi:hypothetical protein